jgi:hypothetical protein
MSSCIKRPLLALLAALCLFAVSAPAPAVAQPHHPHPVPHVPPELVNVKVLAEAPAEAMGHLFQKFSHMLSQQAAVHRH